MAVEADTPPRHIGDFDIPAALVAGVLGLFVGGACYSKRAFGTAWGKANGCFDASGNLWPGIQAKAGAKHPARAFAIAIPFSLVAALVFARVLGPSPDLVYALKRALRFSGGFVATCFGINYQFCIDRSMVSWAVDAGYHLVQFLIFALVLGLWH